ncbi:glycosyltransferase [Oribacterium sp. NK2B42]|uniref:glycosyltransferase n=1 Tax=Oribacterium sp. NK2B42 TaxID=689781 RepID=UPI0004156BB1|nr:glycosyltransferase [Oribacterium sp. NK2B42]
MEYKIQSIILPTEAKHQQCRDLFYRGDVGYLDREEKKLVLGRGQKCDFTTYINACSYEKWKLYTNARKLKLTLDIEGPVSICYVGFHKNLIEIVRNEYETKTYNEQGRHQISFEYSENNETMNGFEISALGDATLYGGYFTVECDEKDLNDVNLSIATTTHKKEEFITKNVSLLKKEIIESEDNIAEHFFVHVVDNGRTLSDKDIYGKNVFLHPNPNAGGAGGFARGMIESIHQEPKISHVLLMDDDVLVLPESIKRTYNLLRLMKKNYEDYFISGAMLRYEYPDLQHEDIGYVRPDGYFSPVKREFNHCFLNDNLDNEKKYNRDENQYGAWWYCCIPKKVIDKYGLPLPLFIRGDDVEYSLRCKAHHITMNGVAVWHMGFTTKFNAAMNIYQNCRNVLIGKATSDIMKSSDLVRLIFIRSYRESLLQFNYGAAELALKAFEDFMKGPAFIMEDRGEEIIKENSKFNDEMKPLTNYGRFHFMGPWEVYQNEPRKPISSLIYKATYNGQRWIPDFLLKKKPAIVGFDNPYLPGTITLHDKVLAVNPYNDMGVMRKLDRKKFKELEKKRKELQKEYKKNRNSIIKAYRDKSDYLKSEEFWRKYLGI